MRKTSVFIVSVVKSVHTSVKVKTSFFKNPYENYLSKRLFKIKNTSVKKVNFWHEMHETIYKLCILYMQYILHPILSLECSNPI